MKAATVSSEPEGALARHGYKQELKREIGWFSSFSMSFSIIAITTGLFATYGAGLQTAGPAFIWTWPVVGLGQLLLALVFAKLARRIPLAGMAYQWTRELSGDSLAWWTGWLMIIQILTGLSAVCYALASYALPALGLPATDRAIITATTAVLLSIAIINHLGIKVASLVNDVMVLTQIVIILLVGVLLLFLAGKHNTNSFHFLFTHPGHPGGLAFLGPLAFSSLMAAWTITGFESAANLAEETTFPERRVPFAIVSSEIFSVIIGFIILLGFTLAIPNLEVATRSTAPFAYIMDHHFPHVFTNVVMAIILVEIYACALANLTILGRIVWAMARDRQLPVSSWFGELSARKVPANAMWFTAACAAVFTWWAKFQIVIAGVSGLAAYMTYVIVVSCALHSSAQEQLGPKEEPIIPKALGTVALVWLVICLGALALPSSAWINDRAIAAALTLGVVVWLAARKNRRINFKNSCTSQTMIHFVACAALFTATVTLAQGKDGKLDLAPTPPMGWASWNYYFCNYDERTIRSQADALVSTGMRDFGYKYVIIQECIAPTRDAHGHLVPDAARFPHGIPALVSYIHSRGLKAGIYTDVGPLTCFSDRHYQGSYNHELEDASTFAKWGIDLVEVDFCNKPKDHTAKELYGRMSTGIRHSGRAMLLYICCWGEENPWEWAPGIAQLWRTTEDISYDPGRVAWTSIVRNFETNALHAVFTAPNSWNDPDMLEVGNQGLTALEARTHYSMWVISSAPLWAGTDLAHMNSETLTTLTNPEVIAIDQDSLGAGVRRVPSHSGEIWSKPLRNWNGQFQAVFLLNPGSTDRTVSLKWRDLGLSSVTTVRDVWTHSDLTSSSPEYSVQLPPHGSMLLSLSGIPSNDRRLTYEAEWPGNVRAQDAVLGACQGCSSGYAVILARSSTKSGSLSFRQVDVTREDDYTISVAYLRNSTSSNILHFSVNDTIDQPVIVKEEKGTVPIRVRLQSGRNRVTIRAQKLIMIDCLTVGPLVSFSRHRTR